MTATDSVGGPSGPPRIAPPRRHLTPTQRQRGLHVASYVIAVGFVAFLAVSVDWSSLSETFLDPTIAKQQFWDIVTIGVRNTVLLTIVSFTGGLALGLLLAVMRLSSLAPFRVFASVFVEIFRGLPLLLTIFIIGYGLPVATGSNIPDVWVINGAGALALTIVSGSYMSETIRAGIEAVPKGQMEAARSLGMTRGRAMRSIVIPQAFRIIIPPLTNELVLLVKDTSLVAVLGTTPLTKELTKFGRDAAGNAFNSTPYVVAGFLYLCITVPLTRLAAQLEKRNRQSR